MTGRAGSIERIRAGHSTARVHLSNANWAWVPTLRTFGLRKSHLVVPSALLNQWSAMLARHSILDAVADHVGFQTKFTRAHVASSSCSNSRISVGLSSSAPERLPSGEKISPIAVRPIALPINIRRMNGSGTAVNTGESGNSRRIVNALAEAMKSPNNTASMKYSGRCERSVRIIRANSSRPLLKAYNHPCSSKTARAFR